jgi:predicted nucleic acid-binding protein
MIDKGTTLDFNITHDFPFDAIYKLDGGSDENFTSPFDIDTSTWSYGQHTIYIEAVDTYDYSSNGTFVFTIRKPTDGNGNGDKNYKFSVDKDVACPQDVVTFTVSRQGGNEVDGATVTLILQDPYNSDQETTDDGNASFTMSQAGSYKVRVSKSNYDNYENTFSYTMCPEEPPDGCEDDTECPSGYECVEGECEPGCTDDDACDLGEVCIAGECKPGCNDDADCPSGYECENGACVLPPECEEDSDCEAGQICVGGECVPECEEDADCPEGYECEDGTCTGIPDMNATIDDSVGGGQGDEITFDVIIDSNGTAPVTNVRVTIQDPSGVVSVVDVDPSSVSELEPGESTTVSVKIKIGDDTEAGTYPLTVVYSSDELYKVSELSLLVSEVVTPGLIWEDASACLLPLLLAALLLLLLLLLLLKKRAVTDGQTLKELQKSGKLGFARKYFVSEAEYAKLPPKLREKCTPMKVTKAEVAAVMGEFKLSEADAKLVALAHKAGVKKIVSLSKTLSKLAKGQKKLDGIEFFVPSGIKPKKGILPFSF